MNIDPPSLWPTDLNVAFLEEMYARYIERPDSVSNGWRKFFQALAQESGGAGNGHAPAAVWRPAPGVDSHAIVNQLSASKRHDDSWPWSRACGRELVNDNRHWA